MPWRHRLLSWDFSLYFSLQNLNENMSSKGAEEMLLKEKVVLHLFDLLLLLCTVYIYIFSPTSIWRTFSDKRKRPWCKKIYLLPHICNNTVHVQLFFVCLVDTGLLFFLVICSLPQDVVYWWAVSVDERLSERMQSAKACSAAKKKRICQR